MITGRPHYNERGDISTFDEIYTVSEVESHLPPIESFRSGDRIVRAKPPIRFKVDVDWPHRLFVIREPALGVHVETPDYDSVLLELAQELDVVWRNYALADENSLDEEARKLKHELRSRFVEE
jgi:hypothetical protein